MNIILHISLLENQINTPGNEITPRSNVVGKYFKDCFFGHEFLRLSVTESCFGFFFERINDLELVHIGFSFQFSDRELFVQNNFLVSVFY